MKLPAAVLPLLLACEASAFSWTGNFGERIVSGSSAQVRDDRYGNVNQLHGKHCHDYTREREAFEATLTKNIQQPPQQQQQQPLPEPELEPEEQPPASPTAASAPATEQIPTEEIPNGVPQEQPQEAWHQAASVDQMQPLNVHDARYGMAPPSPPPAAATVAAASSAAAIATATAQKKPSTPVIQGPSSTTANRIGDRYANSLNDDMNNKTGARPVPDTRGRRPARASSSAVAAMSPDAVRNRGELHGGYGGYSQPLGTFSTVSGSSAQFVDDRYGNINQLHGKHCHDYTQEREAFEAGATAAAAAATAQNLNVMPRPDDIVGKDPNVNQEAC